MTSRPLPDAPDLERFVLGAMLSSGNQPLSLSVLLGALTDADFTLRKHKEIFAIVRDLAVAGKHVDTATVGQEIYSREKQGFVTLSDVVNLTEGLPALPSLEGYLEILREKTRLRSLIVELMALEARAFNSDSSLEIFGDLSRVGDRLAVTLGGKEELKQIGTIVEEIGTEELFTPSRERGIETPISWLNQRFSFAPKSLTILAARPSVGKSALALQCMVKASRQRVRTLLYSLEMSEPSLVRRMVSQYGTINMQRMRMGIAGPQEREEAHNALFSLMEFKDLMLFSATANGTLAAITQHMQKLVMKRRPAGFLIVDYLQLMTSLGRNQNRTEQVSELSRGLKLIASLYNIPVLALSQLSRGVEKDGREPQLSDLRESGSIEQDADNVIFLHRKGPVDPTEQEERVRLILAKQRDGSTGRCDLIFTRRYVVFREATKETEAA